MHYQITFIVDDEKDKTLVVNALEKAGATIGNQQLIGQRRFVYPIHKKTEGIYFNIRFEAPGQAVEQINTALRHSEKIIRFLIIELSADTPLELEAAKEKVKLPSPVKISETKPAPVKPPAKEVVKKVAQKKAVLKTKPEDEKKRQEKLDKMLEELLKE